MLSFGRWDEHGTVEVSDNFLKSDYDPWTITKAYVLWSQAKFDNPDIDFMIAFGGQKDEDIWGTLSTAAEREKVAQGLARVVRTKFPVYKKGLNDATRVGPCSNFACDHSTYALVIVHGS
jgi:chitinase